MFPSPRVRGKRSRLIGHRKVDRVITVARKTRDGVASSEETAAADGFVEPSMEAF